MKISLVIPAYREEKRLPETLERLKKFVAESSSIYEILIVVEKSPDRTAELVQDFSDRNPGLITPILNSFHRGKGFAVKTGVLRSTGDLIFFMDADLSTPLSEVERFVRIFEENPAIEVILGSRPRPAHSSQPLGRRLLGKILRLVLLALGLSDVPDPFAGFKAFRGPKGRELFAWATLNGLLFDVELIRLAGQMGLNWKAEPIQWTHKAGSTVSIRRNALEMLGELFRLLIKPEPETTSILAPRTHWFGKITGISLISLSYLCLTNWILRLILYIGRPEEIIYTEGAVLYPIWRWLQGGPLYGNFKEAPYAISPYSPLYYLTSGIVSHFFGHSITDVLLAARWTTVAASLGSAFLIFGILKRMGTPLWNCFLGALFLFMLNHAWSWMFSGRVDFYGIFWVLAGIFVALGPRARSIRGLLLSGGFFLLAFWVKISFILAPFFIAWIIYDWRKETFKGLKYMMGVYFAFGATYAAYQVWTRGWFLKNILLGNLTAPFSTRGVWNRVQGAFWIPGILLLGLFLVSLLELRRNPNGAGRTKKTLFCFMLASTLFGVVSLGKAGADINYVLEAAVLLVILGAASVDPMIRFFERKSPAVRLATSSIIVWTCILISQPQLRSIYFHAFNRDPIPKVIDMVLDSLHRAHLDGDVLFVNTLASMRYNRPPLIVDTFNAGYVERAGLLDLSPVTERIRRRELSAIVLRTQPDPFFSYDAVPVIGWAVAEAMQKNYCLHTWILDQCIFVPRKKLLPPEAWFPPARLDPLYLTCDEEPQKNGNSTQAPRKRRAL